MLLNDKNFATNQRVAVVSGVLCLVIGAIALIWGGLHPRVRRQLETHTHTVTFTCTRTCTDLTKIPEVFPWQN
jgi:hypothetical protein